MSEDTQANPGEMEQIRQLLNTGQLADAHALADRCAQACPDNIEVWRLLAGISAQLGELAGVEQACRQIIRLQPEAMAWYNLGVALHGQQRLAEAMEAYQQTLLFSPGHPGALSNLCPIHLAQGDLVAARACLEKIPQEHPSYSRVYHELGMALLHQERGQEAVDCFQDLLLRFPGYPGAQGDLCRAYHMAGQTEKTREAFGLARALMEPDASMLIQLADLAAEIGELDAAVELYENAAQGGIDPEMAWYRLGYVHYSQRRFGEAGKAFLEVARINPDNTDVPYLLGSCFQETTSPKQARQAYLKALEVDADKTRAYCKLGYLDLRDNNFGEALAYYNKALALDADCVDAWLGSGKVYIELGSMDEARRCLEKVRALDGGHLESHNLLAGLAQQGSTSSSDRDYLKYVADLFDGYADHFDEELVDGLGYRVPELIHETVIKVVGEPPPKMDILDLGCGTGLCGVKVQDMAGALVGVDISSGMVDRARELGIYTELVVDGLLEYFAATKDTFDLILSGDVFVYFSELGDIFSGCRRLLRPGGWFVFSVADSDSDGVSLTSTGRFAHSKKYIETLAAEHGFDVVQHEFRTLRREWTDGVRGSIFALK